MSEEIMTFISDNIFGVWFLMGAALVFWMQAGFAMVEAGFTRAKNAGNIIMKNLMDFCIGTVMFILIGFSLLLGEDFIGFIGKPGFDIFTAYADFDFSNFSFITTNKSYIVFKIKSKKMLYCIYINIQYSISDYISFFTRTLLLPFIMCSKAKVYAT